MHSVDIVSCSHSTSYCALAVLQDSLLPRLAKVPQSISQHAFQKNLVSGSGWDAVEAIADLLSPGYRQGTILAQVTAWRRLPVSGGNWPSNILACSAAPCPQRTTDSRKNGRTNHTGERTDERTERTRNSAGDMAPPPPGRVMVRRGHGGHGDHRLSRRSRTPMAEHSVAGSRPLRRCDHGVHALPDVTAPCGVAAVNHVGSRLARRVTAGADGHGVHGGSRGVCRRRVRGDVLTYQGTGLRPAGEAPTYPRAGGRAKKIASTASPFVPH